MLKGLAVAFTVILLGIVCPVFAVETVPPEFYVTNDPSTVRYNYSNADYTQISSTKWSVEDVRLKATITDLGNSQWSLEIQAKINLTDINFPYQTKRSPLDADISDDIYYYPYILGQSEKASNRDTDWLWMGMEYPATAFAPLVVMADSHSARIVAAVNWPPKSVIPQYAAQRQVLRYQFEKIAAGSTKTFKALIATVKGNVDTGQVPWQLALDLYKTWLKSVVTVRYPDWMWQSEGIFNVQLQNLTDFNIAALSKNWDEAKSTFPWLLMWGQMSTYAGDCCKMNYTMHERYQPALPDFVKSVVQSGYHAGYYCAPFVLIPDFSSKIFLDTPEGVAWLTGWLSANRNYNANSFYLDTLGRTNWGDPAAILELFKNGTIPEETLIEGLVDIYPAPGLVSGCLTGGDRCGAPFKQAKDWPLTTFPRFGRYLLGDRIIYEGPSNNDHLFWGNTHYWKGVDGYDLYCRENAPCEYGTERLAFLLGAKIDWYSGLDGWGKNPVINEILSERHRVNWWGRRPVYMDTKNRDLRAIPKTSRVEISRFEDTDGKSLIAVSNPNLEEGLTFNWNGIKIKVPVQKIAILDFAQSTIRK